MPRRLPPFLTRLLPCVLSTVLITGVSTRAHDGVPFVPTQLRSAYLRMPQRDLLPMLDWLERRERAAASMDTPVARAMAGHLSALLVHTMMLAGKDQQALALIRAARAASDKLVQRDLLFFTEALLAQARIEHWDAQQLTTVATQRIAALPWPAARSALKQVRQNLNVTPFAQTLALSTYQDGGYQIGPLHAPVPFASDIVETRFASDIVEPVAAPLRAIIEQRLASALDGTGYWEQRAYPPLPARGHPVRVAVWEPDGVDLGLFKHGPGACLSLGPDPRCLADPQIDAMPRTQAWALVKGYQDTADGTASPQAQAWQALQAAQAGQAQALTRLARDPQQQAQLVQTMQHLGQLTMEVSNAQVRQHGTHVAGIVVAGNPFVELVAIRDQLGQVERTDRVPRIAAFLRANRVRIVNMSWGLAPGVTAPAAMAAFEQQMLRLMAALPDTLFVAAAGNADVATDKLGVLPASLRAPNLMTAGAVDQDGQVTGFTNFGANIALYANGDTVRSLGPTGYPLDMSGTSMAAPQVCNVAAKLLSAHPDLSAAQLKRLLIDGADILTAGTQLAVPIRVLNPARSAALGAR